MAKVDSAEVFTSYGGVEARLIVKAFSPELKEKINLKRYPVNLYRDDEIKSLIQAYTHQCVTAAVAKGVKGESLPDVTKKGGAGFVSFASGGYNPFNFKEGKTPTVAYASIVRQEKGATAAKDATAKGKVVGGAKGKKSSKAAAGKSIGSKLAKFTPQGKKSMAKKSTAKLISGATPVLPSPGDRSGAGTTNNQSMAHFKKMIAWYQKKKGGKASAGKKGGKVSKTSKGIKK